MKRDPAAIQARASARASVPRRSVSTGVAALRRLCRPFPGPVLAARMARSAGALAIGLTVFLSSLPTHAGAACRQALVLALDVSGSIDSREYRLQMDGLAAALRDEQVRQLILAMPQAPLALAVFEWAGASYQSVIVDWAVIDSGARLDAVAARIAAHGRARAPYTTGIGQALIFARAMLNRAPDCWGQTVDISGDGMNNDGPPPQSVHAAALMGTATVNALVIGEDTAARPFLRDTEIGELVSYFTARVIWGANAFVESSIGYDGYAAAMKRKLLREVSGLNLAGLPRDSGDTQKDRDHRALVIPVR